MTTVLFWFRRDLRLHDNVGLSRARSTANELYPVYIVDPSHADWPHRNGDRLSFKLNCVRSLGRSIEEGGGELICRTGDHADELSKLCDELEVDAVHWNRCYEPYERKRDKAVRERLSGEDVYVETFKDQVIFEKREITTQKDDPYKVFTPYSKRWKATTKRESVEPVTEFDSPDDLTVGSCPSVSEFGLEKTLEDHQWEPDESVARQRLDDFLSSDLEDYDQTRDYPAEQGTSRLSPYIRFGLLSVREIYWKCRDLYDDLNRSQGIETFVDELIWRDFYHQILWNFPRVADGNFHEKYNQLEWEWDEDQFEAWKTGRTGYPIVDAAMRQLNQKGWMHNRLRMIVASFLTKDLLIHWKRGETYFMNQLLDGDTAANNGGWQWAASTGTDAAPYFRIFNPASQSEKYDPDGEFIREFCPELSDLPDDTIHEPFNADEVVLDDAGVQLGNDYPEPIVDHATARERALERFESVSG